MTQRKVLWALTAVFALIALPISLLAADDAGRKRPNVILVITDDQGYGDVGALGNTMIRTPNLDVLHGQSVHLTDFHVDPTCSPTRSALNSGRYSTRTGVWHTIMGRSLMNSSELTIAEVLKSGGYRTGMFGKWHLGENYPLRPQDQGFDDVVCHGGGGVGNGPDWWGNDYFDDTYFRNGKPEKFTGYCTDVWFAEAMKFIERNKDRPFFTYLSTNAPHGPLNVAEKYSQPYVEKGVAPNMAKFYGMITNIDENMGRLMAQLERLGIADDTILIFMTDNGTAAGRPIKTTKPGQWAGFNDGMRGAKGSEYEGGHRVPFFIRWPAGGLTGGRDVGQLTAHVDVLPTLAELTGVKRPDGPPLDGRSLPLDGKSLVPLLRGKAANWPDRTMFVHSQRIPDPEKWRKSAVMTERWRLVNGRELFDIQADPGQKDDVGGGHPEVVKRLRGAYEGWWKSLSVVFDKRVRIALGSDKERIAQLHPHDWHVTSQGMSSWHQSHVQSGHLGNGFWAVDVTRPGTYEFELRRWPKHLDQPIEATRARLKISEVDVSRAVPADATKATFKLELKAGRNDLQTWLTTPAGKTRGAFYVYVKYLE